MLKKSEILNKITEIGIVAVVRSETIAEGIRLFFCIFLDKLFIPKALYLYLSKDNFLLISYMKIILKISY